MLGRSKLTKVTFNMVRLGVLGVLIPPVPAGLVLTLVCEMMRESYKNGSIGSQ